MTLEILAAALGLFAALKKNKSVSGCRRKGVGDPYPRYGSGYGNRYGRKLTGYWDKYYALLKQGYSEAEASRMAHNIPYIYG